MIRIRGSAAPRDIYSITITARIHAAPINLVVIMPDEEVALFLPAPESEYPVKVAKASVA